MFEEANHTGWHVTLHSKEAVAGEWSSEICTYLELPIPTYSNQFQRYVCILLHTLLHSPISALTLHVRGHYPCLHVSRSFSVVFSRLSRLIAKWINQHVSAKPTKSELVSNTPTTTYNDGHFRVSSTGSATWEFSSSGSKFRWNLRESGVPTYHTEAPTFFFGAPKVIPWNTGHCRPHRPFQKMSGLK